MKKVIVGLIVWLLIGLGGVVVACGILLGWWDLDGFSRSEAWNILSVSVTWLLVGGIFAAFWQIEQARRGTDKQLQAARKSTNAQVAVELFRELRDPKIKGTLRFVYESKPEELVALTDKIKDEEISHVLDWLDLLGSLVNKEIVDKELAIKGFAGNAAVRCWYKLAEYIRQKQQSRGYYARTYEDFVHRCLETFGDAHIEIHIEGDDRDLVRLIQELPEELRPQKFRVD